MRVNALPLLAVSLSRLLEAIVPASVALLRGGDSAAVLSPLSGIALLPGLLWILLLLMLRVLPTVLTALLTTAWIVFMGTLSELRALLLIGHLKPPGIFIPSSKLGSSFRSKVALSSHPSSAAEIWPIILPPAAIMEVIEKKGPTHRRRAFSVASKPAEINDAIATPRIFKERRLSRFFSMKYM